VFEDTESTDWLFLFLGSCYAGTYSMVTGPASDIE
jgi:hypothetical protein